MLHFLLLRSLVAELFAMPTSAEAKSWTEVAFNCAKIVALIVAGGWTYYQWDKVIFPKESAEQFARRVAQRTDLVFDGQGIQFKIFPISSDETESDPFVNQLLKMPTSIQVDAKNDRQIIKPPETNAPSNKSATAIDKDKIEESSNFIIYAFGNIEISNQKNFPIELQVAHLEIRFGRLRPLGNIPDADTLTPITSEWVNAYRFDPETTALGKSSRTVIESKATISIPVTGVFAYVQKQHGLIPAELMLEARALAVNPETGDAIASSTKDKVYKEIVLLDPRVSDDPVIGSERPERTRSRLKKKKM